MTPLPPGPRTPMALQTLQYGLTPYPYFRRAHRRHGDVFTLRVMGETWVVLAHPDHVREVFTGDPDVLWSGEANESLRILVGRRNVLLLDGPEHLRRRKLVLPPFHGERMRAYEDVVREVARDRIAAWPLGTAAPVLPRMRDITFEVVLRAVFGVDDRQRLERLRTALDRLLAWTTDVRRSLVFGILGPERIERNPRFRRQIAAVDAELAAHVRARRADPALAERADVLSMLLLARDEDGRPLGDDDLRDELVTLLVAGHETTSALLAWAIHELARTPGAAERLAAGEDGYADAVVAETLRLRPPVPLVVRRLKAPLRVAGHDLPAGSTIAPCGLLIHERPDVYPDPRAFLPERFLGTKPPSSAWLPFGGGVRRCIGAAFAQMEARLVLEELATAFVLRPDRARRERVGRRGIVLVPARGGRVVATPRPPGPPLSPAATAGRPTAAAAGEPGT